MATGTLTNLAGSIKISKQTGTVVTFDTDNKFVTGDIALTVNAQGATPSFTGGTPSGTATINSTTNCNISSNNTSGIIITTGGTCSRAALTYSSAVNGWVTASNGATPNGAGASSSINLTPTTYYLTKVKLTNGKSFQIEVPNGSENPITFTFTVDNQGNTTIT